MKALSLCSGIGGIDLACEWAGIETIAFCEIEKFCQKVLNKHWPNVPVYDDLKELTKERLDEDGIETGAIGIIHSGYPCQPFSNAGNRQGTEDDRHLWPEVFRLIQAIKPRWFVGENVAGHVTLGLDIVLADLESIDYAWEALVIPAVSVDARHRRDRVFIVAHSKSIDPGGLSLREKTKHTRFTLGCEDVSDTSSKGLPIGRQSKFSSSYSETGSIPEPESERCSKNMAYSDCQRKLQPEGSIEEFRGWIGYGGLPRGREQWAVEPNVGGKIDGISRELDGGGIDAKKARAIEVMRILRSDDGSEDFRGAIRRLNSIQQTEILQPLLRELKEIGIDETWLQLESSEAFEKILRSLWSQVGTTSTPHRPGHNEQRAREYTDALQVLSRFLAQYGTKTGEEDRWSDAVPILNAWGDGWEDGIPRVATGVKNRVDRLKSLGNAVVPQQIYPILAAIKQIDDMLKEG